MVEYESEQLSQLFHALADPTRRGMLQALTEEPMTVGDLAAPFAMSLAAASKHIRVLEQAGLIRRRIEGRTHFCELNAGPMHGGYEWISHYQRLWSKQLDTLEQLLQAEDNARSDKP